MPELLMPYTAYDLTLEVNRIPNDFGYLNELNIAPSDPKRSRLVRIDYRDGQIYVLSHTEPGGPSEISGDSAQSGVILEIPHFVHLEKIGVDDLDGLLEVVNGQIEPKSLDKEIARKLDLIRKHHGITREFIRLGMLKGEIKDGKLKTLYNLFDVFGIEEKVVAFALGTAETDVRAKCEEVSDHIIKNATGETVGGIEMIVDTKFFNKLISHAKVEKFWLQAQNAAEHRTISRDRRGKNWGRVFEFGEIVFREYKGALPLKANDGAISMQQNVANLTGHAYPTGTQSLMRTFDAPPYHISRVNQAPDIDSDGGEIFISPKELDHGEGWEFKTQSNALAVCKQPKLLVKATTN